MSLLQSDYITIFKQIDQKLIRIELGLCYWQDFTPSVNKLVSESSRFVAYWQKRWEFVLFWKKIEPTHQFCSYEPQWLEQCMRLQIVYATSCRALQLRRVPRLVRAQIYDGLRPWRTARANHWLARWGLLHRWWSDDASPTTHPLLRHDLSRILMVCWADFEYQDRSKWFPYQRPGSGCNVAQACLWAGCMCIFGVSTSTCACTGDKHIHIHTPV